MRWSLDSVRGDPVEQWWAWWLDERGAWRRAAGKTAVEALSRALALEAVRDPLVDPRPGDVVMHQADGADEPEVLVVVAIKGEVVVVDAMDGDLMLDRAEVTMDRWRAEARRSWVLWLGESGVAP